MFDFQYDFLQSGFAIHYYLYLLSWLQFTIFWKFWLEFLYLFGRITCVFEQTIRILSLG